LPLEVVDQNIIAAEFELFEAEKSEAMKLGDLFWCCWKAHTKKVVISFQELIRAFLTL